MQEVHLDKYDNSWYKPGSKVKRVVWHILNTFVLKSSLFPFSPLKAFLLRLFGARIGKGVVIKPNVNIKYPWNLEIENDVWIGEKVWIDNLDKVKIGKNVCLSQGCLLLSGSHDYTKQTFDLRIAPIILEDGAWIGAKAIVNQGVTVKSHAVLSINSVATSDIEAYSIYRGNPAQFIKKRNISE